MGEDKGRYYFAGEAPQIFIVPGHTTQSQQIVRGQSTFVAIQHNISKKPESSLIFGLLSTCQAMDDDHVANVS